MIIENKAQIEQVSKFEIGRYCNIDVDQRKCKLCVTEFEDAIHSFIEQS